MRPASLLTLGLASAWLLSPNPPAVAAPTTGLATQGFRDEHVEIRKHLEHAREWAGQLPRRAPEAQRATAKKIHAFFAEHIRPHAEVEERGLYTLVDKQARATQPPFTATMRQEHRVVGRWIDELGALLAQPKLDATAFARRTDNLLGLLDAHFESEEQVLLPVIDRSMTRAQFDKEMSKHAHH
jgi:hemerythrin-like domain-containing protein